MKRVACLIGLLMATALASPTMAQEPVEREHVVRRGDTLWDLAAFYFSDPFGWPDIYEANTTVVEDPHWIYPDEVLVIPGVRGDTEPQARGQTRRQVAAAPREVPARTVFYRQPPVEPQSDADPTVLSEPTMERVPVRPGQFLVAPYVDKRRALETRGIFVGALRENREIGSPPTAHPKDAVFLRYEGSERPTEGQQLLLIRVGDGLAGGRILEPTGVLRVTRLEPEALFAVIETQYGEIFEGQVAVPMPMYPDFMVEEAAEVEDGHDLEGRLIHFMGEPPLPSITDLGFVDLGARDGVKVGDVFTAVLPERASRERGIGDVFSRIERLPPEEIARLRVVRVGPEVATVRVESLLMPRLEPGLQVRRTHRIP